MYLTTRCGCQLWQLKIWAQQVQTIGEKVGEITKRSAMFIKDSTTRGSIISRVDDELCQKLICRCRQARKSGAAAAMPPPLLLPSPRGHPRRGAPPPTPLRISTSWFGMPPGFGPCHNTSLRTFDFPSAAAADLLLLFFAWLVASLMPPSLTSLNQSTTLLFNFNIFQPSLSHIDNNRCRIPCRSLNDLLLHHHHLFLRMPKLLQCMKITFFILFLAWFHWFFKKTSCFVNLLSN